MSNADTITDSTIHQNDIINNDTMGVLGEVCRCPTPYVFKINQGTIKT